MRALRTSGFDLPSTPGGRLGIEAPSAPEPTKRRYRPHPLNSGLVPSLNRTLTGDPVHVTGALERPRFILPDGTHPKFLERLWAMMEAEGDMASIACPEFARNGCCLRKTWTWTTMPVTNVGAVVEKG